MVEEQSSFNQFVKKGWRKILKGIAAGLIVQEKLDSHKPEDQALMEFRRDVCSGNEQKGILPCKFRDKPNDMCKVCGCFLDVKIASKTNFDPKKRKIVITHCPNGFWGDKQIADHYASEKN
jgi:hypothetical protein